MTHSKSSKVPITELTSEVHFDEGTLPITRHIGSYFRLVASLDRKCLGQKSVRESGTVLRGIFDKETRRKPVAVAADALSYGD